MPRADICRIEVFFADGELDRIGVGLPVTGDPADEWLCPECLDEIRGHFGIELTGGPLECARAAPGVRVGIGSGSASEQPAGVEFGAAWWFLDQKEGIEMQVNALSNVGLLSRFVGMLTDSRSFMSYPRHEYFRRVLCRLIGADVACGEIPDDDALLGPLLDRPG